MEKKRVRLALSVVLLVAAWFRFYDLNWDEGQHTHPDERWIAMVAPTITWPDRARWALDPRRSTLNPLWVPDGRGGGQVRNFAYGHLPLYLQSFGGHTLAALGRWLLTRGASQTAMFLLACGEYGGITLVGRFLSALFDLGTVLLVYLLGKRVYGAETGLLGASLVAVSVTHIQLAHFATFDAITTFFTTLATWGAVAAVQADERWHWPAFLSGVAAGMAVASKFSALPILAAPIAATTVRAMRHVPPGAECRTLQITRRAGVGIALTVCAALLAFALTSPFALLDWRLFARQIAEQGAMVRGRADLPFTRQYIHTMPFLYQITQQVRWGLGWPLGVAAFAGLGWTLIRQFRCPHDEELVLLSWSIPYFIITGSFMVKFMRYMLPLLPIFVLTGAAMLWRVSKSSEKRLTRPVAWLRFAPHFVLTMSALWSLAFLRVYAKTHPWIQASRWIYAHVPDGSVLAVEHWDDRLPLSLPESRASPDAHGYAYVELPMYEPDTPAKLELIRSRLRQAQYIILASNRLYRTIQRLPERYPISAEYYRLLFAEKLGYTHEVEFTAYPGLLGIEFRDDDADESFTVYDHPKPILFRKVRNLSDEEWNTLFAEALRRQPVWEPKKREPGTLFERKLPVEGKEKRTLLLDRPVGELPVVADFWWNRWASDSTVGAVITWWLVTTALGWLAWPLTFTLFDGLRDRGYAFSRAVSLLVVGYLVWLPAALHRLKNGLPLTLAAIGILAGIAVLITLIQRHRADGIWTFSRQRWRLLLLEEGVFGAAFLAFVVIRVLNPDLWQPWNGGEKSMDIAYLNACLRSAYLPPYDPYYSDGYLNYYYYGQFLLSIVTRVTGLRTTVAFNLAVPFLFAMTVVHAFAIGHTLADGVLWRRGRGERPWSDGLIQGLTTVLCVAVLGNLASARQVIERLGTVGNSTFVSRIPGLTPLVRAASGVWQILFHGATFPGFNYWDPSRVVPYTINEFPYWSFLFADLHPHMINIPFTLLIIALALNRLRRKETSVRQAAVPTTGKVPSDELSLLWYSLRYALSRVDWAAAGGWLMWPLALGALAAINTWDWPTYAGLSGLALLFAAARAQGKRGIIPAALVSAALAGISLYLYSPFFKYYTALYVGLGWSLGRGYTRLGDFLTVWGFFLFLAGTLLILLLRDRSSRWAVLRLLRIAGRHLPHLYRAEELHAMLVGRAGIGYRLALWSMVLTVAVGLWCAWKGYWVLTLMLPLLLLAAALMVQKRTSVERQFVLMLIFTSFLLLVGVELFYLKDHLAGDERGWWRMNTLFKFYLQAWVMLGVGVGASLPAVWAAVERWRQGWRWGWTAAFTLLLVAAALYPVLGTPARVADRFPGARPPIGTLDGMAFMTVGVYYWPDENHPIPLRGDYAAIRWLMDNVRGTPVLAEAPIGYYREFGVRVASYTGLPTLLGMHESEQRYGWQVGRRSAEARELFNSPAPERTRELLHKLRVRYVYLGPLERVEFPGAAAKFAQMAADGTLQVVYENDLVTIYEVR